jgi:hypothetical protein
LRTIEQSHSHTFAIWQIIKSRIEFFELYASRIYFRLSLCYLFWRIESCCYAIFYLDTCSCQGSGICRCIYCQTLHWYCTSRCIEKSQRIYIFSIYKSPIFLLRSIEKIPVSFSIFLQYIVIYRYSFYIGRYIATYHYSICRSTTKIYRVSRRYLYIAIFWEVYTTRQDDRRGCIFGEVFTAFSIS